MGAGLELASSRFRPTLLRRGYDADEVESFVESVELALRSPAPGLSAADLATQRFTVAMLNIGYRMDDVDAYLDLAQRVLRERERSFWACV